jgi:hypothetical protein
LQAAGQKMILFIAIHLLAMSKKRKGAGIEPAPV